MMVEKQEKQGICKVCQKRVDCKIPSIKSGLEMNWCKDFEKEQKSSGVSVSSMFDDLNKYILDCNQCKRDDCKDGDCKGTGILVSDAVARVEQLLEAKRKELAKRSFILSEIKVSEHTNKMYEIVESGIVLNPITVVKLVDVDEVCSQSSEKEGK